MKLSLSPVSGLIMLSLAVVVITVSSGCSQNASTNSTAPINAGTYELVLPETESRYTLVIPEGYNPVEPVPLILSLHYGGQVTPFYSRGLIDTLIAPALSELGAIIVAPDNVDGGWANTAAEAHIFEFIDYVQENYNIDNEKTLITGVSMGGMGTWYIAPRYPERFKVAIPVSGRPQTDSTGLDWTTPLYIIHSNADEIVDIAPTITAVEALRERDVVVEFVTVDDITHYEFDRLQPQLRAAIPWIRQNWQ